MPEIGKVYTLKDPFSDVIITKIVRNWVYFSSSNGPHINGKGKLINRFKKKHWAGKLA